MQDARLAHVLPLRDSLGLGARYAPSDSGMQEPLRPQHGRRSAGQPALGTGALGHTAASSLDRQRVPSELSLAGGLG